MDTSFLFEDMFGQSCFSETQIQQGEALLRSPFLYEPLVSPLVENENAPLTTYTPEPQENAAPVLETEEKSADENTDYLRTCNPFDISNPFLSPYSTKCNFCTYWRKHSAHVSQNHLTCLCLLFESNAVCCVTGYENLLRAVPSLAPIIPIPDKTFAQLLKGVKTGKIVISIRDFESMIQSCNEARKKSLAIYFARVNNMLSTEIKE